MLALLGQCRRRLATISGAPQQQKHGPRPGQAMWLWGIAWWKPGRQVILSDHLSPLCAMPTGIYFHHLPGCKVLDTESLFCHVHQLVSFLYQLFICTVIPEIPETLEPPQGAQAVSCPNTETPTVARVHHMNATYPVTLTHLLFTCRERIEGAAVVQGEKVLSLNVRKSRVMSGDYLRMALAGLKPQAEPRRAPTSIR
jgi:hypothetical protein